MPKKAIVLSGGGSKGAWGVGVAKALLEKYQSANEEIYDVAVGTSTGSLMAPFILADDIQGLETGYTSVNQDVIFNVNPFKSDGGIKVGKVIERLVWQKKTFGESEALKTRIYELITQQHFDKIRKDQKVLGVTVGNFNTGVGETKSNIDLNNQGKIKYSDDEMRDWIWASSNNPMFMSEFTYTDPDTSATHSYADGGMTSYANIEYVLNNHPDVDHIDVIYHNTPDVIRPEFDNDSKILSRLFRLMDIQGAEIFRDDIRNATLRIQNPMDKHISLDIYYMTDLDITTVTGPSRNSLIFDKQRMQTGVMRGYELTKKGETSSDRCTVSCRTGVITTNTSNIN